MRIIKLITNPSIGDNATARNTCPSVPSDTNKYGKIIILFCHIYDPETEIIRFITPFPAPLPNHPPLMMTSRELFD
ncbi:hypothetical protein [Candidatus Liberibacter solanacearum]|uniref:hypothetical protein n=1 Tax=Candidatus Liberibacter solanacearum TaxID=556287 RepID=UPI00387DD428